MSTDIHVGNSAECPEPTVKGELRDRYAYATMDVFDVLAITKRPVPEDSFLSKDQKSETYFALIRNGFRWVRTDHEHAIFERKVW